MKNSTVRLENFSDINTDYRPLKPGGLFVKYRFHIFNLLLNTLIQESKVTEKIYAKPAKAEFTLGHEGKRFLQVIENLVQS